MPPSKKNQVSVEEPLVLGEQVLFETKDGAQHTGVTLGDEKDGKVQVALQTTRGRKPMFPFVLLMSASDLVRV